MGFFGTFVYSDGRWGETATSGEYLRIDIHDSDIATVDYRPAGGSQGRFYLGHEPRHYFEDPSASEPTDVVLEMREFIVWADRVVGVPLTVEQLVPYAADADGADPSDVFVEETVIRFIGLLGLPLPNDLDVTT